MFEPKAYSAAESVAAVSTVVVSAVVSVATLSLSELAAGAAVLLPQDAKEIAAIATNIKTNFFIFFAFFNL